MADALRNLPRHIWHLPRKGIVALIVLYQHTLSPDHGPLRVFFPHGVCVYEPTCSEYGKQIVNERGVVVGGFLLAKRLLSCHPWGKPNEEKIRMFSRQD